VRGAPVAALAAGAVAGAVLLAGALAGWWSGRPGGAPPAAELSATATIEPRSALFGDTLTATLDVGVDPRTVDPASVAVSTRFAPYQASDEPAPARASVGGGERLTFTYRLTCLRDGCLPPRRGYTFAPATIRAARRDGGRVSTSADWPPVTVASRVTQAEASAADPAWRDGGSNLVPVTWGIDPELAAGLLAAGAALLALLAGAVAAFVLRSRRPREAAGRAPARPLSPLQAALAATRQAARGGGARERRRALELLARVLRRDGEPELARAATRLAWSAERPAPARVDAFAAEVERAGAEKVGT
jgi:hypothetical protein